MKLADNTSIDPFLRMAASSGNFEPFQRINKELSLITTPDKSTILHVHLRSSRQPSISFIEQVLNKCPSLLFQANVVGDIPLHLAAKHGHHSAVECLINHIKGTETGGDVKTMLRKINDARNTALHEAVQYKHPDVVRILAKEDPDFSYSTNKLGKSPLYIAVEKGRIDGALLVEVLCTNCRLLDYGGPHGKTALHAAAKNGSKNLAEMILGRNQTLTCTVDEYGWTPLHYAAYNNKLCVVQLLLGSDDGAAYMGDAKRNMTPLHLAAGMMYTDVMKEIATQCESCRELVDIKGRNVLHFAMLSCDFKDARIIREFLPIKKLLRDQDDDGNTPAHLFSALHPGMLKAISCCYSIDTSDCPAVDKNFHPRNLKDEITEMSKSSVEPYVNGMVRLKNQREEINQEIADTIKEARDSYLLAAALIAAMTFTAIFTMPGGYIQSSAAHEGSPILQGKSGFQAFMIFNTISFILSLSAVAFHFFNSGYVTTIQTIAMGLAAYISTVLAMLSMILAFVAAAYVLLAPSWVAVFVVVIGAVYSLPLIVFLIVWCFGFAVFGFHFYHFISLTGLRRFGFHFYHFVPLILK